MKKRTYISLAIRLLVIASLAFASNGHAQSPAVPMANTVMSIWKDSLSQNGRPAKWTYDQGVVLKGIEGLWQNTGEGKYFYYIQKSMDFFVDDNGNIRTYKPDEFTLDNVLCARNLL